MDSLNIQTLPELIAWQGQQRNDAIAFTYEGRSVSYRQLDRHTNQIANGLLADGVKPQSRIAILGKDSDYSYELLLGCAKAKAVLIGINWRLAIQETKYILNDSEAEIVFVSEDFFPVIRQLLPELEHAKKIITLSGEDDEWPAFHEWRLCQPATAPALSYDPTDVVVQMYTSGTTGHPKGVQLPNCSFFRLMAGMRAQGDTWMSLNPDDKLLVALPQFHIGGLWWAVQGLIVGAQNILMDTFIAWKALELIAQHRISKIAMVPAMLQTTLAEPSCNSTDLSCVQGFLYGGSPIAPALLQRAIDVFQCGFYQIYGMTETGNMAVCLRPEDHYPLDSKRLSSAGKPLPGVQVCVVDDHDQPLPANQSGEICIKSPSNMLGYWKNDEATRKVFFDGWIRTGDVGYLDDDGYVYVCDRIKDMIIYGGENIYPAEIEAILSGHEAVLEAAVIGIPDERWGETVKAFVVLRPGNVVKQRELINFVRGHIADFKTPKSIDFVETLPRNPSGKLLKRVLREPYWDNKTRQVN
jgi:acyl-CoA synthetase (AMP-forming)/AMP-acid ligase II